MVPGMHRRDSDTGRLVSSCRRELCQENDSVHALEKNDLGIKELWRNFCRKMIITIWIQIGNHGDVLFADGQKI